MKYYDATKKRLVFTGSPATPDFWDSHWNIDKNIKKVLLSVKNTMVSRITMKYLAPSEGAILEGGCGSSFNVMSLVNNGYRCIGVDYAPKTIKYLKESVPELEVELADVRNLPFKDNSFSGYWSWGVIEHFYDGCDAVLREMLRVVKNDGYVFLVFPHLSLLRRLKAKCGFYPAWDVKEKDVFYQFAFLSDPVIEYFKNNGFELKKIMPFDGIKGIKSEIGFLRPALQKLYSYKGNNLPVKIIIKAIDMLASFWAGHSVLLIFRKFSDNGRA
jgi:ubiquinone/menaquinone biosynthesis C-methylase UbiE